MSQNQNQIEKENQNQNASANDIDREIERLKALREKQSQQQQSMNVKENPNDDKVTEFLNSEGANFTKLPAEDGGKKVYQFFADKKKRRLVIKRFIDPKTKEAKDPQTRVQYDVIDPTQAEAGEKQLECPKTLAQQIEDNINKGHCLLEITRRGTGVNSRYSAIAC